MNGKTGWKAGVIKMEWYDDKDSLAEAIDFVLEYRCLFGWTVFISNKTPCTDYKKIDEQIPDALEDAIEDYLENLTTEKSRKLNREISELLGERFFTRKTSVRKILGRILYDGNPMEKKDIIEFALVMQIANRERLLKKLRQNVSL